MGTKGSNLYDWKARNLLKIQKCAPILLGSHIMQDKKVTLNKPQYFGKDGLISESILNLVPNFNMWPSYDKTADVILV